MPGIIIVGMQWGDEGKGKVVDLFSKAANHVVRSQGGNNAGHTIVVGGREHRFHLIPSGIVHPHVRCWISGGTVVDLSVLQNEIMTIEEQGISLKDRLHISAHAHLVLPYHAKIDRLNEESKGDAAIGTTGCGIGPCYADRINRIGLQVGDLVSEGHFKRLIKKTIEIKNEEIKNLFKSPPISLEKVLDEWLVYRQNIVPLITDVEAEIACALSRQDTVLFEGAHGTFLDINFGTYPYVTSSQTIAAAVCAGAGIGPTQIDHVVGVIKSYTTRVGGGPFPTELNEEELALFATHAEAREIGTTTGRKRRLGWFDGVLASCSARLNGISSIAVTKLDILDRLPFLKICVGYHLQGRVLKEPPATLEEMQAVKPIYEQLPGWQEETKEIKRWEDLPQKAKEYLLRISHFCKAPIHLVSVGPERERTIRIHTSF